MSMNVLANMGTSTRVFRCDLTSSDLKVVPALFLSSPGLPPAPLVFLSLFLSHGLVFLFSFTSPFSSHYPFFPFPRLFLLCLLSSAPSKAHYKWTYLAECFIVLSGDWGELISLIKAFRNKKKGAADVDLGLIYWNNMFF